MSTTPECIQWHGYIHIRTGRAGMVSRNNVKRPAYVWAFLDAGGVLTEDKPYVIHSCDNPACVEPTHLRAGSPQDNMDDKVNRGRWRGREVDACPQGHSYTDEANVSPRKDGGRRCLICARAASRRHYARKTA